MRFANPSYFLWLIPACLIFFLYLLGWLGKDPSLKFSSVEIVKKARAKRVVFGRLLRGFIRLVVVIFIILALARPQTGTGEEKTTKNVIDIMLVLDISGSMATLDFHPDNRLAVAKQEAKKFVEGRNDDRIGLVVFAGQSFTQCPLTVDRKAVLTLIDKVQMGVVDDGTAIGLGLANGVNRLKDSEAKSKVVILLTDGINNAGEIDPLTAAGLAKQLKVRVYTIGVGREGTSLLPVQDPQFGTRLLRVETQIDEKTLKEIARQTGGLYFRAQDQRGLREIFNRIDQLERTQITVEQFTHYEEQYFWFLWPAFFIFLFEIIWNNLISVKWP